MKEQIVFWIVIVPMVALIALFIEEPGSINEILFYFNKRSNNVVEIRECYFDDYSAWVTLEMIETVDGQKFNSLSFCKFPMEVTCDDVRKAKKVEIIKEEKGYKKCKIVR